MKILMAVALLALATVQGAEALVDFRSFSDGPVVTPGFGGAYDAGGVYDPELIWDGSLLRMYYTAVDGAGEQRIALSLSTDGSEWVPYGVVLNAGSAEAFDRHGVSTPAVVWDGARYRLYYTAAANGWLSIGRIDSADGYTFDRLRSPARKVLDASWSEGSFDRLGVSDPSVFVSEGVTALMYEGHDATIWKRLGLAGSADGESFTRVPGAAGGGAFFGLGPHGFDDGGALAPDIFVENGEFRLFYTSLHY